MTGTCLLCQPHEPVPAAEILEHLRLLHPQAWEGIETWPDGGAVLHEDAELFWMEAEG